MNKPATSNPMRLLDPAVLAGLRNLELVARSVVDGVLLGLHKSPNFGFSQEFEEYRQYQEGDDTRYIDWNVYARSDRTVIKRFKGETNSPLTIILDTSASMGFQSENAPLSKHKYACYLAASLAYMATRQKDALGLIVFDEQVQEFRPPSSKTGQLQSVLHAIDTSDANNKTELDKPLEQLGTLGGKRGMVALISDFYCDQDSLLEAVKPLTIQGQDLILMHTLDPVEINPEFTDAKLVKDPESGATIEVTAKFMRKEYPQRMQNHINNLKDMAGASRADYVLMNTAEPLDRALHQYLTFRQRRK